MFADKFAVICKSIVIQNLSQILSHNLPLITQDIKGNTKYLISGVLENFSHTFEGVWRAKRISEI